MTGFRANILPSHKLDHDQQEALRLMIGQIPLALAIKNGGELRVKIDDIDNTGGHMLEMRIDHIAREFVFTAAPLPAHLKGKAS